jgi:exodeoxyribonuclease V beta subunit
MEMDKLQEFDILKSPLQGTNLIEAGAGTGKTYAITALFLRLILEKALFVDQILVVTYTVAATEELRDRIRRKLREAIAAFSSGQSEDQFMADLVLKIPGRKEAIDRLQVALHDFDEAPIFTIHGFCQRTLHERAFESGSLFDTELSADQQSIPEEIANDFWRRHFYEAPPELVIYAQNRKYSPGYFLDLLKKKTPGQDPKVIPESGPVEMSSLEPFRREFERLKETWPGVRQAVLEKFSGPALKYYANPEKLVALMDQYTAAQWPALPLFEKFEKFTTATLAESTKKKQVTPVHPFFDLCQHFQEVAAALSAEMDRYLLFLKAEIFRYLAKELPARKQKKNIQFFDDLLTRLASSLQKAGGEDLVKSIQDRYKAALIDEFQDTDPVQYAIFHSVFARKESILFLIGDPKQAIYSFRGADLFAYLKAAAHVDSRYTLTHNWRSEPGLIRAVNEIFSRRQGPFVYDEISFQRAGFREHPQKRLSVGGKSEPPFRLWFLEGDPDKPLSKERARESISRAVAAEISRLIDLGRKGKTIIGDHPVREEDIAVLVRTNDEAAYIQESLRALGIHSVLYSTANVFDSDEALEMDRVLAGIAEPNRESLLRAALATDMLGLSGEALERLTRDETAWEDWLARFREYYETWERQGFIRMFRYFLDREKVRSRLLSLPGGERRLTNVLHLSEILHQEATERKLGMLGLLKWLTNQRNQDLPRLEEHQLRLESDANAVRVVTIHKSKGLEYPIVFCPFNWAGSTIKKNREFTFHDVEDEGRLKLVIDPAGDPRRRSLAEKEILAENLRLLYVSLTRAKNRCYLVWGRFHEAETSSLAYILHPTENKCLKCAEMPKMPKIEPAKTKKDNSENIVEETGTHFSALPDEKICEELKDLSGRSDGTILFADLPREPGEKLVPPPEKKEELACSVFSGRIIRDWRIASFSSLVSARKKEAETPDHGVMEAPDHDQETAAAEPLPVVLEEPSGIFAFPKGARAGTMLHEIFESLDFTGANPSATAELVAGKLRDHGFELHWQETLCQMLRKVLSAPLLPGRRDFTLSRLTMKDRLSELEFYFPLRRITPEILKEIFVQPGEKQIPDRFPEQIENLAFRPARGYMKGFIDLVFLQEGRFYLVDWKSNFLGPRVEDYDSPALQAEMDENFYALQYHLYVLALHQYLRMRLPDYAYEKHFGGVFYIFLRGVDPESGPEFGIFRALPGKKLIEGLAKGLIAETA